MKQLISRFLTTGVTDGMPEDVEGPIVIFNGCLLCFTVIDFIAAIVFYSFKPIFIVAIWVQLTLLPLLIFRRSIKNILFRHLFLFALSLGVLLAISVTKQETLFFLYSFVFSVIPITAFGESELKHRKIAIKYMIGFFFLSSVLSFIEPFTFLATESDHQLVISKARIFNIFSSWIILLFSVLYSIYTQRRLFNRLRASEEARIEDAKRLGLGVFAAGIAHEINNPLAIIKGAAKSLRTQTNEATKYTTKIENATGRIAQIVQTLLSYVDPTKKIDSPKIAEIKSCTRIAIDALTQKIEISKVKVIISINQNQSVQIQKELLVSVLYHVLQNSIDATINSEQKRIEVSTRKESNQIEILIEDTGVGIPTELKGKVFDPFFTTKAVGEGRGLGLSLTQNIVKSAGGEILIRSEFGKTSVSIKLPLAS
ncbi:MAG: hypothetical protein CL678_09340 [Bdellovibrionaceae bacterium]|nr:hypothetical protein [Pseudobdellovibrionaceae bacterium]|tara:strand:- start:8715 stop:9992 length:1278 start_codon:yes stop_codon:yes gene_type:complete